MSIDMTYDGARTLAFAIIEQAVEDYRSLVRYGIIKDGKVVDRWEQHQVVVRQEKDADGTKVDIHGASTWPISKGRPMKISGMKSIGQARTVHRFFNSGDCDKLLRSLGSNLDSKTILKQMDANPYKNFPMAEECK